LVTSISAGASSALIGAETAPPRTIAFVHDRRDGRRGKRACTHRQRQHDGAEKDAEGTTAGDHGYTSEENDSNQ